MKFAKNALVVIVATLFSLGSVEFALRYVGRLQKIVKVEKIESGWGWKNSPLRYLQPHSADSEVNQLGLRGKKIEYASDDFVVLLVGDSQVEAAASQFNVMPESLLEARLTKHYQRPVKVFSIAASGWGQDQQLLALEKYFKNYRANLVLVWSTPVNDFWENTFPDRSATGQAGNIKPSFLLVDNKLKGPYYESSGYYYHSALFQLISQISNNSSINQVILDSWMLKLPKSNKSIASDKCRNTTEIHQDEFFKKLDTIDLNRRYTIISQEDIARGRTHFSSQLLPASLLGDYQIEVTKQLIEMMQKVSFDHNANFAVFYPIRQDLDNRMKSVSCIKTLDQQYYVYVMSNTSLLNQIISREHLITFHIMGSQENIVSNEDRHLNEIGNQKVVDGLVKSDQVKLFMSINRH